MIPKDPVILLSFVNLKLRDFYKSFEDLCEDLEVDQESIISRLSKINYVYSAEKNQFI